MKPELKRRLMGLAIVAAMATLQGSSLYLATHDPARLVMQVALVVLVMVPLMLAASAGFRYATKRRWPLLPTVAAGLLVAASFGVGATWFLWRLSAVVPALHTRSAWPLTRVVVYGAVWGEIALGLWAFAFVFPMALDHARVRSLEADKLRTAAELARLRANLEPHFLLNTLNAIAGLVTEEPREARRLLAALGDLLRDALRDSGKDGGEEMQTLDDEVAWLRRYAQILEARHAGQLVFRWDIAGQAGSELVPRLLLQPLVENAVKHGALKREGGAGEVLVRASVDERGRLVCVIQDNGPGMGENDVRSGAFGLHAVRRRLELRYAEQASLRLESSSNGTRSVVELPRSA